MSGLKVTYLAFCRLAAAEDPITGGVSLRPVLLSVAFFDVGGCVARLAIEDHPHDVR